MRFNADLNKKEVLDSDAKTMGVISDIIIDDDTFEITDVVLKGKGIAETLKSNGEYVVPIEMLGAIGDKIFIKKEDEI
ncbi:MAG: PRC-barrel domain-containing protein [Methanobrevibacter sp.]|uniref:PRC-barrel domain-containing protein n=1 Tax=Methanobrevibacter sp. TaxID=66852 RepID=UPI0026DFB6C2|nr:PRC-barrel domain-containing protein [Methanobrevibacter sp.]MDO5848863.1 PRC-barrel domain-containing protein [Methanobrevibacter sp.]